MSDKAISPTEEIGSKIAKLLPAEVTALYLSVRPFAVTSAAIIQLIVAIICLIASILFIWKVRNVNSVAHIAIYALTFGIWIMTIEPEGVAYWMVDRWHVSAIDRGQYTNVVAIISIFWTFFITFLSPKFVASSDT